MSLDIVIHCAEQKRIITQATSTCMNQTEGKCSLAASGMTDDKKTIFMPSEAIGVQTISSTVME